MTDVETVLVVFLSSALLVFLILGIVAASYAVAVLRNVHRLTRKAADATENVSDILDMVGKKVAPVALSGAIAAALRKFTSNKEK
jgi:hypothetical protein